MVTLWILTTSSSALDPDPVAATELPARARDVRNLGISPEEVREALAAARAQKLPPSEAAELLGASAEAAEKNGRIDNFGSFVRTQLDAGLRGRDLAAAIHAEHADRGQGRPDHAGKGAKGKAGGAHGGAPGKGAKGKSGDPGRSDPVPAGGEAGKGNKGKGRSK